MALDELELLTPRELEVLKLMAEGHSSKEIATTLVLSIKTVESQRGRVDLTRYAIRRGLIEPKSHNFLLLSNATVKPLEHD